MQFGSYLCGFKNKKAELGTDYESSLFIKSNPTIILEPSVTLLMRMTFTD